MAPGAGSCSPSAWDYEILVVDSGGRWGVVERLVITNIALFSPTDNRYTLLTGQKSDIVRGVVNI